MDSLERLTYIQKATSILKNRPIADRLLKTSKLSKKIRAEEIDFTAKRTIEKDQIHDLLKFLA